MSDATPAFDFSQFVPGFDFLKNLTAGAAPGQGVGAMPGLPSLSSWVAPTINVEEVDKRIQELKTVQYWLEQNGHALKATIQALEVQKMTLTTLRGMNVRMEDLANAFTRHANTATAAVMPSAAPVDAPVPPAPAAPAARPTPMTSFFSRMASAASPAAAQEGSTPVSSARVDAGSGSGDEAAGGGRAGEPQPAEAQDGAPDASGSKPGVVDPLQWWGALTHQFQQIAESAMKDAAQIQMPTMPQIQMPNLSGAVAKPAKTGRTTGSARTAQGAGTARAAKPSGAARAKASPASPVRPAGARSTSAAVKAAPRKSAAASTSTRRSRG
jgi:hypothetical protein